MASSRGWTVGLLVGAALVVAGVSPQADAAQTAAVATVGNGFAPSVAVVEQGETMRLAQLDIANHGVVSVARDQAGTPLFRSRGMAIGEIDEVAGVEQLSPGEYAFRCSLHPFMQGTLIVR